MAAALSLLTTMLASPQISFGGSQSQAAAVQNDRAAEVETLIRELGDPKFVVREAASQKLAAIGKPAVAALKLAAESESLEIQVRAQSILAGILLERGSNFDKSEQQKIKQFIAADMLGRVAILRSEATSRSSDIRLFIRMLDICVADEEDAAGTEDGVDSAIKELIALDTNNPITQWVTNLLDTRRWDYLDKLLTHPGILKHSPMLQVSKARNAGELDAYVDNLFQQFSKAQENEKPLSTRELVSLSGLLRVLRDFDRAEKVIAALPDVDLQQRLLTELLFQQGDWEEILRRTKLDPTAADFISANPLQRAFLHHLLGDADAIAGVEQELRQQLKTAKEAAEEEKENTASVKLLKGQMRILGAVTLDWPLMQEFFAEDNLVGNVSLMLVLNRPNEALKLLEIGPSFKDRQTWVQDTLKEMSEAQEKLKKLPRGRRDPDYDPLEKLISEKKQLLYSVVDMVEQWGLDDEAQLYCQMIFSESDTLVSGAKLEMMKRLLELGRTKEYWQMVELHLKDPTQRRYSSRNAFGIVDSSIQTLASSWSSRIRGAIASSVEEAKTIAAIMNSPAVDREGMDFDLDFEIARLRTQSLMGSTGEDEYLIGTVLELNGQDDAADGLVKQAAQLGNSRAIRNQFFQAMAKEDPYEVLEYWLVGNSDTSSVSQIDFRDTCFIAEEAALKILETETDPEKISMVKKQLDVCRLAIAVQWTGGDGGRRWSGSHLGDVEKSHLATLRLQCLVYGVPGDFLHRERQDRELATALLAEGSDQKHQGAIKLAAIMFDKLGYAGASSDIGWSYSAINLNIALGQGLVERKEYDRATEFLVRTAKFSPGDVSVGEGTIKKLAEAGESEAADQIYQAVGKHFVETLKDYPDSPLARNNFAWLSAISNRDLESARRHVAVAVKVRPHVEQYWDTFAELEFMLGQPKEAFEMSKRCIQLNPSRFYYRQQKARFRKAMSEVE